MRKRLQAADRNYRSTPTPCPSPPDEPYRVSVNLASVVALNSLLSALQTSPARPISVKWKDKAKTKKGPNFACQTVLPAHMMHCTNGLT